MRMRVLLSVAAGCLFAGAATADGGLLYDNGDHDPTVSGGSSFGWNQTSGFRFALSDEFTVPAGPGWDVNRMITYGYTTGNSPMQDMVLEMYVQIRENNAGAPGNVVVGDMVTGLPFTQTFTGDFRGGSDIRPIYEIEIDLTGFILSPGDYFVEFNGDNDDVRPDNGGNANLFHPFFNNGSGNGYQYNFTDQTFTQRDEELDFKLFGSEVPAPGVLALLGVAGLAARRRRRA